MSRVCLAAGLPTRALSIVVPKPHGDLNPQMLIGRFYHSLVKAVVENIEQGSSVEASLIDAFPQVVHEFSERYPRLNLDFDPFVQRIYDTVRNNIEFGTDRDRQLFVETEISSKDSLLFGSPDWVMVQESGIQLIDFKLTTKPDRLLSEKNTAQLSFYSYLVAESYGQFPTDIQLVGLNGAHAHAELSPAEANKVAKEARACQRSISVAQIETMSLEDFANPSPQVCPHCRYIEVCGKAILGT